MNNLYKIVVPLVVSVLSLIGMLCCPQSVFASDTDIESLDVTFDGKEIPYFPDSVYGKNYILVYYDTNVLKLFVLPDGCSVKGSGTGGNSSVITLSFSNPHVYLTQYVYSSSTGWSDPEDLSSFSITITPPSVYILRSTVDIYNSVGNSSAIYFAKNADIIVESDIDVFLGDFGNLVNGFIGCVSKSTVGIVSFFMIVAGVVVGNFYLILWR